MKAFPLNRRDSVDANQHSAMHFMRTCYSFRSLPRDSKDAFVLDPWFFPRGTAGIFASSYHSLFSSLTLAFRPLFALCFFNSFNSSSLTGGLKYKLGPSPSLTV